MLGITVFELICLVQFISVWVEHTLLLQVSLADKTAIDDSQLWKGMCCLHMYPKETITINFELLWTGKRS